MPSASPFEGGLICGINKSTESSSSVVIGGGAGAGWDCDEYFPMCDDLFTYTVSVVHNNNSSSNNSNNNNNSMAPHLGHQLANSASNHHEGQPQQQQQHHLAVDVSPDASVVGQQQHHHHLHTHHVQQQQQQQQANDFMVHLLPLGGAGNQTNPTSNNNNNNNTNSMNNNSTTSHKTIPVFSSSFSNGAWEKKLPADWDESDTIDWLFTVANKLGIPCEYFASFGHLTGSNLLEMNKDDFQSKYPNHGHKFYEAFRQLVHQIQLQQHSPAIIDTSTDLLGLQNTPAVHHHHQVHQTNNVDCWSMLPPPPSMEQNNYTSAANGQPPENRMMVANGGYCGPAHERGQHPYSNNNSAMDSSSSYIYLNASANLHHHSHHQQQQQQQQHHSANSKSLGGYGSDPIQLTNFQQHHHHHHQQQHQQHESYDSYSLDMMGPDHYSENYSNSTPSSDPEEMMAAGDGISPQMMANSSLNTTGLLKRVGRPSTSANKAGSGSSSSSSSSSSRRRKQDRGYGKLWEFIRDLLHDPKYCPSMVRWEDVNDGVFRIVQSEKLANLWGTIKNNPRMTYEKLSRAMRYYYKSKVFLPVLGRRLVYKFGPHAVLWKPDNPNFEHPTMEGDDVRHSVRT